MPKTEKTPAFELVLQVRDLSGKPTGKTKSFKTDNAEELDNFFLRNSYVPGKKKGRKPQQSNDSLVTKIINKLEKNTKLPRGWDEKGGLPLNINTFEVASQILRSLEDLLGFMPRIIAVSSGAARLEFQNKKNEKELDIIFNDQYSLEYYFYDPNNSFEEERVIGTNESWRLRELFLQFNKIEK